MTIVFGCWPCSAAAETAAGIAVGRGATAGAQMAVAAAGAAGAAGVADAGAAGLTAVAADAAATTGTGAEMAAALIAALRLAAGAAAAADATPYGVHGIHIKKGYEQYPWVDTEAIDRSIMRCFGKRHAGQDTQDKIINLRGRAHCPFLFVFSLLRRRRRSCPAFSPDTSKDPRGSAIHRAFLPDACLRCQSCT